VASDTTGDGKVDRIDGTWSGTMKTQSVIAIEGAAFTAVRLGP
jgi:hypothetical protein